MCKDHAGEYGDFLNKIYACITSRYTGVESKSTLQDYTHELQNTNTTLSSEDKYRLQDHIQKCLHILSQQDKNSVITETKVDRIQFQTDQNGSIIDFNNRVYTTSNLPFLVLKESKLHSININENNILDHLLVEVNTKGCFHSYFIKNNKLYHLEANKVIFQQYPSHFQREIYISYTFEHIPFIQREHLQLKSCFQTLTPAETDIVVLLCSCYKPQEMASIRNKSVATIRTQIKNILDKLSLKSTQELIALAYSNEHSYERHNL